MSLAMERTCPVCAEEREFRRVASMQLHLGEKVKWRCSACDHQVVTVDGVVDTGAV